MTKKILLVAYHFPPSIEVGGLRIANWCRHLPQYGWTPYVLTVMDKHLDKIDPEKLKCVGSVKIMKAGLMPSLSSGYLAVKKALQRLCCRPNRPRDLSENNSNYYAPSNPPVDSMVEPMVQRLRRYIRSFLTLPDQHRNWILPALIQGLHMIRHEKIDCVLTSGPPHSAHLVGWVLKLITDVRWIVDFRDPWMTGGTKKLYSNCEMSLRIDRWLEWQVLQRADLVVANTERLSKEFQKAYGGQLSNRSVCIANGFDAEFFSRFSQVGKVDIFTIVYAGTLYFGRTPEPVLRAVHELIQEGCVDPHKIRIRLVGQCRSIDGGSVERIIQHYRLDSIVEVLDSVSYDRAVEMVKQSHLALLLAPNQPYQIPAKVYDYMGIGTTVLALTEDGATSDLVQATGIGAVFQHSDVAGIKKFIVRSMNCPADAVLPAKNRTVADYEIRSLARSLAHHLDQIIGRTEYAAGVQELRSRL